MPARPLRVKIKNELGVPTTLPNGEQYLHLEGSGEGLLILGLGPDSALCARLAPATAPVYWTEAPDFIAQMPPMWHAAIPAHWRRIGPEQCSALWGHVRTLTYSPAVRLFPSFWHPLLAQRSTSTTGRPTRNILLPAPPNALIVPELAEAASALGYEPVLLSASLDAAKVQGILRQQTPALFLSVNFHGLDAYGHNQSLLEAAGVPTAVWCVDNPFHLLSSQKNHLWKRLVLAVTDDWFLGPLRELGATAIHLPLATSPTIFAPSGKAPAGCDLTFVGRSRFPERDAFFAACTIPHAISEQAEALGGRKAHFGWWEEHLGKPALWPGNTVRTVGLGAEKSSEAWRRQCLSHIAHHAELRVFGDHAWKNLLPHAAIHAPVDYYSDLAAIYRTASFSLNLTSLLLPHGLTQRHFDVWACGGFLLSDTTPGMHIFPNELTRAISFATPDQALTLARQFADAPRRKEELRSAWQRHIVEHHTYTHRLRVLLDHAQRTSPTP